MKFPLQDVPKEMLSECQGMVKEADEAGDAFGLVIVDTLQAFFNGDDSNSNAQVVKFMRALRPITELSHKPTVLVPSHPTKNAGDDNLVPYGGGGILNETDGNLTISRKGDIVEFHHQDKLRGVPFEPIMYKSTLETADELTDQRGRPIELPVLRRAEQEDLKAAEQKSLTTPLKILQLLVATKRQSSVRAVALAIGVGKSAAGEAAKELKVLGLIKSLPGGGIEITGDGVKHFKSHGAEIDDGAF
jgi:AAA domain